MIRRYRPDVVILVFSGTPRDGHGQHQTSAMLGKEAFDAAADPKKFPEQLKYVQPWQAKRLVRAARLRRPPVAGGAAVGAARVAAADGTTPGSRPRRRRAKAGAEAGETGGVQSHPRLFVRRARGAQPQHAPQPGHRRHAASRAVHADVRRSPADRPPTKDLFDGIDTTWNRLPGGAPVEAILAEAIRAFEPAHPERACRCWPRRAR